eukprot:NODE_7136_length_331_cov_16.081560_g6400_i0.p2 GENE.NODE_7136_length_331_cov_16.081560_g6400_i0~~NODE_7136_length_331_cov_16.081560_g6400_i0.p2  ORF type:complete len:51 (-),score=10.44 NODE_7136_length_331_cov_16.081560_g6400_i0:11-163(-)
MVLPGFGWVAIALLVLAPSSMSQSPATIPGHHAHRHLLSITPTSSPSTLR